MSRHKKQSSHNHHRVDNLFLQLPSELLFHILEFVVDKMTSDNHGLSAKNSIRMMATFEGLSCQLNSRVEIREYLNTFWWRVFELEQPETNSQEIEKAKLEMIKKNCLKRKILLFRYARRTMLHQVSSSSERSENVIIYITGCRKSGKSSIINSFVHGRFDPNGVTYYPFDLDLTFIQVNEKSIRLEMMDDTCGEKFTAMKEQYMRNSQGFVVVSSIDNFLMNELTFNIELILKAKSCVVNDFPVMFALNKIEFSNSDSNYRTKVDECRKNLSQLIKKYDLANSEIFETDATNNESLQKMFEQLGKRYFLESYSVNELLKLVLKDDVKVLHKNNRCILM